MNTARVFRSGNGQAVRLPKQFRLRGKEVEIFRRGDEIVLREKDREAWLERSICWRDYPRISSWQTGRMIRRGRAGAEIMPLPTV